ncbi:hypothetical protein GCM10009827_118880 [Dactylosporangium maewongense]|uniref:Uncharacterized protein n=2 Tax=Dactylosporangium maewongense TaxID=634393 RepID=A0ABN2DK10_9ACTN
MIGGADRGAFGVRFDGDDAHAGVGPPDRRDEGAVPGGRLQDQRARWKVWQVGVRHGAEFVGEVVRGAVAGVAGMV